MRGQQRDADEAVPRIKFDFLDLGGEEDQVLPIPSQQHFVPRKQSMPKSFHQILILELGWVIPNWECLFVHSIQKLFVSVYVDAIKMAGKNENSALVWKKLMKEEPTSFLDST